MVIQGSPFVIPDPAFVIPTSPFVIPDSIRDPVLRRDWIADQVRNDKGRVWHATGNSLEYCNLQCTFTGDWLVTGLRCGCEMGLKINVGGGRVLWEIGGGLWPDKGRRGGGIGWNLPH